MPPRPGKPAPWIEAAYRAAQSNSAASDEERIMAAIRAYFNLMAESHILGEALDLGIVIDRSSEAGESLYRYELGLLQYRLTMRKYYRIVIRDCQYDPRFDSLEVTGDTARARVELRQTYAYADTSHVDVLGDAHTLDLTRTAEGWKLSQDVYRNEATDTNPRGTDFAARELGYLQRMAAGLYGDNPPKTDAHGTRMMWPIAAGAGLALVAGLALLLQRALASRRSRRQ
jgi:hypothetical protein